MRGVTLPFLTSSHSSTISIHTPHAGSDPRYLYFLFDTGLFQSTLPMRGATGDREWFEIICQFQSTLPMRGATWIRSEMGRAGEDFNPHSPCGERHGIVYGFPHFLEISIHTPHAGSDLVPDSTRNHFCLFQSTLPMRGATI